MKILLIMPDAGIHRIKLGPLCVSFREAPLTLTMLAALVPRELRKRRKRQVRRNTRAAPGVILITLVRVRVYDTREVRV